ncbi:MAG: F0F1 ATP synthase subunit epsilon [Candidatus Pacebacteria bacterium]|nr:F0F1 ATP synthase subunit epsilon [Candidatus Paceibacterota bacterium]
MKVVIAKVDENLYDGEAESLTVPGAAGEMTVLGEHMPIVTTLKAGTITVRGSDGEKTFDITGGVLEVRRDGATVIL